MRRAGTELDQRLDSTDCLPSPSTPLRDWPFSQDAEYLAEIETRARKIRREQEDVIQVREDCPPEPPSAHGSIPEAIGTREGRHPVACPMRYAIAMLPLPSVL